MLERVLHLGYFVCYCTVCILCSFLHFHISPYHCQTYFSQFPKLRLRSYHLSLKYPLRILKEENEDTSQCFRPLLNHSRSHKNFDVYYRRPPTFPPYILTPHSQQPSTNSKSESGSSEQTAGTNPKN